MQRRWPLRALVCVCLFPAAVSAQEVRVVAEAGAVVQQWSLDDLRFPRVTAHGAVVFVATTEDGDAVVRDSAAMDPNSELELFPLWNGLTTPDGHFEIGEVRTVHALDDGRILVEAEAGTEPPAPAWFWVRPNRLTPVAYQGMATLDGPLTIADASLVALPTDVVLVTDGAVWHMDGRNLRRLAARNAPTSDSLSFTALRAMGVPGSETLVAALAAQTRRPILVGRPSLDAAAPGFALSHDVELVAARDGRHCFARYFETGEARAVGCDGRNPWLIAQRESPTESLTIEGLESTGALLALADGELAFYGCSRDAPTCHVSRWPAAGRVGTAVIEGADRILGAASDNGNNILLGVERREKLELVLLPRQELLAAEGASADGSFVVRKIESEPWALPSHAERGFAGASHAVFRASDGERQAIVVTQHPDLEEPGYLSLFVYGTRLSDTEVRVSVLVENGSSSTVDAFALELLSPSAAFAPPGDVENIFDCVSAASALVCSGGWLDSGGDSFELETVVTWPLEGERVVTAVLRPTQPVGESVTQTATFEPAVPAEFVDLSLTAAERHLGELELIVRNDGNDPANGVFLSGAGVDVVEDARCEQFGGNFDCRLGRMAPGDAQSVFIVASESRDLRVSVESEEPDRFPDDNQVVIRAPEMRNPDEFVFEDGGVEETPCGCSSAGGARWVSPWLRRR